jgi:hypothetical protein
MTTLAHDVAVQRREGSVKHDFVWSFRWSCTCGDGSRWNKDRAKVSRESIAHAGIQQLRMAL